jgi:hypothetical protein
MTRHLGFKIGDVLKAGDDLSEWIATIAIAVNDTSFAGSLVTTQTQQGEWIYSLRVAVSHFTEAAKYLEETASLPVVEAFVASLTKGSDEYATVLRTYRAHKARLHAIRDVAAFHYPAWRDSPRRPMKKALEMTADSLGLIRLDDPSAANRLLFADEIVSAIVARACGGRAEVHATFMEVVEAINAFAIFADAAIDRYLVQSSVTAKEYELVDPNDYSQGWRTIAD